MTDLAALRRANAGRWANAKLTRASEFTPVAKRLVADKVRFQGIEAQTGVPWWFVAVVKQRESGNDPGFNGNIANGQPWSKRTTIVPKGRGPFKSWEEAAFDALRNCAPYAAKNTDWSIGGALTLLEQYNGLGYASRGLPSPYLWSGTDQYQRGKYVRDGVYDANAIDKQLGCAGLILAMQAIDPSIQFGKATGAVAVTPPGKPNIAVAPAAPRPTAPYISNPAAGSVGAKLTSWFSSLFKRAA